MLGERGLWYKMSFFEWAARVPLVIAAPGRLPAGRQGAPVSLLDLFPTLVDLAGGQEESLPLPLPHPLPGRSLLPYLGSAAAANDRFVPGEYLGESAAGPLIMLRRGRHKYVVGEGSPAQLFDLAADPLELQNLAGAPEAAELESDFAAEAAARWDFAQLRADVIASQRRRRFVFEALRKGTPTPWDFQPRRDASQCYARNLTGILGDQEGRARLPFVPTPPPDGEAEGR
jgi:choline-sulfatase